MITRHKMNYTDAELLALHKSGELRQTREFVQYLEFREAERLAPLEQAATRTAKLEQEVAETEQLIRIQELRYRLVSEPSPDFAPEPYTGNYSSEEITRMIEAAYAVWSKTVTPQDADFIVQFTHANPGRADITKPEGFEACFNFVKSKFKALETVSAPAPVTPVEPETAKVNPHKWSNDPNSEYARFERAQYREQALTESAGTGNELFHSVCTELVEATGLTMHANTQIQFRDWLSQSQNRNRFTPDRRGIRLGAAEFFNEKSFLSESEREEIDYNRTVASMTSDDLKRAVGFNNSYDPNIAKYQGRRS